MSLRKTCPRVLQLLCAATIALSSVAAFAADPPSTPVARPKIGLALSGGGARGAAHIGVLQVLEEHRVPIDYIAGTSMGALVGGLYASGMSAADLERVISEIDWAQAFTDNIPREDRSFRRKRDDDLYLIKEKPGLRGWSLQFPPGLIDGQQIDLLLKRHTLPVVTIRDFDDLSIPYRAVAADVTTGDAVVLERGDLALAMRASMAIPAVFAPREIDGTLLVDGGITQNLPIQIVRDMGADVIIAVDISTPPVGRDKLRSVIEITGQLTTLLSEQNKEQQIGTLTDRDILIQPDLGSITTASFDHVAEAIPIGVRAARQARDRLAPLSLSEDDYRVYRTALTPRAERKAIDELTIVNRSRLADGVIAGRIDVETGAPLDADRVEKALEQVYGLELFESVYYDVTSASDRNVLAVTARERAWGPNYVQAGIAAFEDFESPDFNLALAYTRTAINRLNGEWRAGIQVGRAPGAFTELYQPVDTGLRKFVHVRLEAEDQAVNVFGSGGHKTSELEVMSAGVDVAIGRELGTWGEVRGGMRRGSGEISTRVGDANAPSVDFNSGDAYAQFFVDMLDDVNFPRAGGSLRVRGTAGLRTFGSDVDFEQVLTEGTMAATRGRWTGLLTGLFGTTVDSDAPVQNLFTLGGFMRISGVEQDELVGQHAALVSGSLYRRMSALLPLYVGLMGEYGNVFRERSDIRLDNGIVSGGAFVGLNTFIGPIVLAYARAEAGRSNYYLSLGQTFHNRHLGSWRH